MQFWSITGRFLLVKNEKEKIYEKNYVCNNDHSLAISVVVRAKRSEE